MKVRLSKLADRDLTDIYKYSFREFGKAQAERYYFGLWECFEFLSEHPHIGRLRLEFQPPARSHHHRKHVVFYDLEDDHILITRILHERMDLERHSRG